jgi:hypothetical protein
LLNKIAIMHKPWPEIHFEKLKDTLVTVHLWTQIVGKIRLRKMPWLNHSWHVSLYVSPRGLTTGSIPYAGGLFELEFDFLSHELVISSSEGKRESVKLFARSVANFHAELFEKLRQMEIEVEIHHKPNELEQAIPFALDEQHRSYDAPEMTNLWQVLVKIDRVFNRFRAGFIGKNSPVHLFWGAFDLAVTRFSGRQAPKHPGGAPNMPDEIMQEAYSHEVSSCGFWPGNEQLPSPIFYAYCYPTPPTFADQPVEPASAFYSQEMGEFILPYEAVQQSEDPDATLMQFLKSTYRAAALTGNWDPSLECDLTYLEK